MTKEKLWHRIRILLHIIGCALFIFAFLRINVCRFYYFNHPYFELIVATVIMLTGYSFYFFFVSKYYTTGFFVKFWSLFVFCNVAITILELILLLSEYKFFHFYDPMFLRQLMVQTFFLVLARNICLVGLLVLLRMNHYYRINYQRERKTSVSLNSIYNIISNKTTITLNVKEIVYIQHQKNYTCFYMMDGRTYSQYISLVKVIEDMPEGMFAYANRNTLVNTRLHFSYNRGMLYLNEGGCEKESMEGISVSKHYKCELMEKIKV